jgi:RNA polymerase sigma factor (sigma-70 family)
MVKSGRKVAFFDRNGSDLTNYATKKSTLRSHAGVTLQPEGVSMPPEAQQQQMAALLSDEQLIRQALAGSQPAFATIVKRYEQYMFTLVVRWVRDREAALEVTQDCFLRAFRYLGDFRGECKFSTWLYKIAYHTSLNHLRKFKPDIQSLDDAERPVALADHSTPDAGQAIETAERHLELREAIALLSPEDASIITLFYLHEQTLEEICEITQMTMTNAKTRLCRARQRLKPILEARLNDIRV